MDYMENKGKPRTFQLEEHLLLFNNGGLVIGADRIPTNKLVATSISCKLLSL